MEEKVNDMEFCVKQEDILDRFDEKMFSIIKYKTGFCYTIKNGFRLFVNESNLSLYNALNMLFNIHKEYFKPSNKQEEDFMIGFSYAMTQVLQSPITASANIGLLCDLTDTINKYLQDVNEKIMNPKLEEDDNPELTEAFKDAIINFNEIADQLKKEADEYKERNGEVKDDKS